MDLKQEFDQKYEALRTDIFLRYSSLTYSSFFLMYQTKNGEIREILCAGTDDLMMKTRMIDDASLHVKPGEGIEYMLRCISGKHPSDTEKPSNIRIDF